MKIKNQLCNIVKQLKTEHSYTYDKIVELGGGAFHKSQLILVLTKGGDGVSVDVICDIIACFGVEIEIHVRNRSYLHD